MLTRSLIDRADSNYAHRCSRNARAHAMPLTLPRNHALVDGGGGENRTLAPYHRGRQGGHLVRFPRRLAGASGCMSYAGRSSHLRCMEPLVPDSRAELRHGQRRYRPDVRQPIAKHNGSASDPFQPVGLLQSRRWRIRTRRGREKGIDHWITSSARSSSDCGIVRPSTLAVVRFTTRWNLVGCSTGRVLGLAPFKIWST